MMCDSSCAWLRLPIPWDGVGSMVCSFMSHHSWDSIMSWRFCLLAHTVLNLALAVVSKSKVMDMPFSAYM